MPITNEEFARAQASELDNWASAATNPERILHELIEHAEPSGPLRRLARGREFRRALEVGIGCYGLGFLGVHLADCARAIDGIDPLPRIAVTPTDAALRRYVDTLRARVNYIQSKAEAIPARDGAYDLISCVNVIDHAQEPERIAGEMGRVLADGGLLLFGVNTLSLLGELKWRIVRWLRPHRELFVEHPHTYQWHRADALVRNIGACEVLWAPRPSAAGRLFGHGRMSFWIARKGK